MNNLMSAICTEVLNCGTEDLSILDDWLEKNNISLDGDYTRTGCMIYIEPQTARECVMQDILNKE